MIDVNNVKSQMRKGMLEYCILLILKNESSYASDIIQQLKQVELIVVEGTIYPLLTRLKNGNLLSYQWQESTQGPPRKYYLLTKDGEKFLKELDISWQNLTNTVTHIKNKNKQKEENDSDSKYIMNEPLNVLTSETDIKNLDQNSSKTSNEMKNSFKTNASIPSLDTEDNSYQNLNNNKTNN